MKSRIVSRLIALILGVACCGSANAWAAPCGTLLQEGNRFDAVVTASSGRLLARGPLVVNEVRPGREDIFFIAGFAPNDGPPQQLSGMARGGEVSMVVDAGELPEAAGQPAWLGVCGDAGITGRIGGEQEFELLPVAADANGTIGIIETGVTNGTANQTAMNQDEWPAASEAPIIIPEPEDEYQERMAREQENASDAQNETVGEDPVAKALRELQMETQGGAVNQTATVAGPESGEQGVNGTEGAAPSANQTSGEPSSALETGYALNGTAGPEGQANQTGDGNVTAPTATAALGNETASVGAGTDLIDSAAGLDLSDTDCRYLPSAVYAGQFPHMRLSPIHSTEAFVPGQDERVCFLALQGGSGQRGPMDFAFYTGPRLLATLHGPGIPVTVSGMSLRDLNGDGAPEVVAVMQRADGGYENRVYWSEKKGGGYEWVDDPVVNRYVSEQPTVGGVIAIVTGEKTSSVTEASETPAQMQRQAIPAEPALTPEPMRARNSSQPAIKPASQVRQGDVLDLSGRFVRGPGGLLFTTHGSAMSATYMVASMPPDDEARLGELTRRDSRISAEVMRVETDGGKRVIRIQVLQVVLL